MSAWDCPACGRRFGHANQSHTCAPAISLEERLARLPADHRAICEAVLGEFEGLVGVIVEPVEVGFFVKRARSFAQLRPMKSRVRLIMMHGRPIEHERVAQPYRERGRRIANVVDIYRPEQVDDDLRAWLSEAYADAPD
jgi:hypothetical protein